MRSITVCRRCGKMFVVLFAICASATSSFAIPIEYFFRGTGSGSFENGPSFVDADFVINLTSDTMLIEEFEIGLFDIVGPATIDIDGAGSATFSVGTRVFNNKNVSALGFSLARPASTDLIDLFEPEFASYALDTAIGPIVEDSPVAVNQFLDIPTTQGNLTFTSVEVVSFQAVIVPEPATMMFVLIGASVCSMRRRVIGART